jgi:hypothetical protein
MDDYLDFVEISFREANPVLVARQKSIEKQILRPFSIAGQPTEQVHTQNADEPGIISRSSANPGSP